MRSVRETYDIPKERPGITLRQWLVMLAAPLLALVLWRAAPDSPITVALVAIAMLAAVFTGVALVLSSRRLDEEPGRNPTPPPSVTPPRS
ncbi:MAG: hypothetical protein QOG94_652 [Solirubrobacteraceae bacterium]|jgi:hypothetical protein|nr:hypothetical protein [Solirubrobacteraceae bacterium]MEA2138896.1 hypothetical protein [Solirubrobacteraceae bacterium]